MDLIELKLASMMWQTVLRLSKHADEQLTVTFTASNLENGGFKK
jgi:hypothetical protein